MPRWRRRQLARARKAKRAWQVSTFFTWNPAPGEALVEEFQRAFKTMRERVARSCALPPTVLAAARVSGWRSN